MRSIGFLTIIGSTLAAPKRKTHDPLPIVVPETYEGYAVEDYNSTCTVRLVAKHETFRKTYELVMKMEKTDGLRVSSARCSGNWHQPKPDTGRDYMSEKKIARSKQELGDLFEKILTDAVSPTALDCESRLSRAHRALARKSRRYRLLVGAVGGALPSSLTYGSQEFFGPEDERAPETTYALINSICDYLQWKPLLDNGN